MARATPYGETPRPAGRLERAADSVLASRAMDGAVAVLAAAWWAWWGLSILRALGVA